MLINKYKGLTADGDIVFDIYLNIRNILVELQTLVIWYHVSQSYRPCSSHQVLLSATHRLRCNDSGTKPWRRTNSVKRPHRTSYGWRDFGGGRHYKETPDIVSPVSNENGC